MTSQLVVVCGLCCAVALTACSDHEQQPGPHAGGSGATAVTGGQGGSGGSTGGTGPGGSGGTSPSACEPDYPQPELEASAFGVVGDGVQDDTAALQDAMAELEAAGGTLVLEAGHTYLISDRLEIRDGSGFAIQGNGATLKAADGTPTDHHNPLSFRNCSGFAVADLFVDGNRDNRTPEETGGGHNIRITGCSDWMVCRVDSHNATTDGFYVSPSDNADPATFPTNGLIGDCSADNNFRQGMSIINGRNLQVIDSSFTNTNGTSPQAGIDIEPNSGSADPGADQILIRGCHFAGNVGYGLTMGGHATTDHLTIEDCVFDANEHGALTIQAGYALVQDNVVENHSGWVGLHLRGLDRAHHVVVRHNTFRNNPGPIDAGPAWIYVNAESGTNNVLLDNTFENNEGQDIANNNPDGTCAAGNLMDGQLDAPADSCGEPPVVGYGT